MKPPAFKLPTLVANLPHNGVAALVRPAQWPANSFYKVTRTKLKFQEKDDQLTAGGKVWGQLFWKGKLQDPRGIPAPRIRGGLKYQWLSVDPKSLTKAEREAINGSKAVLDAQLKAREDKAAALAAAVAERKAASEAVASASA